LGESLPEPTAEGHGKIEVQIARPDLQMSAGDGRQGELSGAENEKW